MIRFTSVQEPPYFDARVRQRGLEHIRQHPLKDKDFYSYWRECAEDLKAIFASLCAYSIMKVDKGDVEHFVSQSEACKTDRKYLIYEWSNYRYADPSVNQTKTKMSSDDILDPYIVEDNWFEMDLPSTLLRITSFVPEELQSKARNTIMKLKLNEKYVRERRENLYKDFYNGNVNLNHVRERGPLVERAIRKRLLEVRIEIPNRTYDRVINGVATLSELEEHAGAVFAIVRAKLLEAPQRLQ